MLWVTITIVTRSTSSESSSSMRFVALGSREDVGLVHQQNVRFDGERPRDTQALLLPPG